MYILSVFIASLVAIMVVGCGGGSGNGSVVPLTNDQNPPTTQGNNVTPPEDNPNTIINTQIVEDGITSIGTSTGLTGDIRKLGLVEFKSNSSLLSGRSKQYVSAGAGFTIQEYDLTATAQLDTCTLYQNGLVVEGELENNFDYVPPEFIDAGEVLPMLSPSGTYGELDKTFDALQNIVYEADLSTLTYPAPNDLTIDIAGGDFPAFSNIPIPNLEELVVIDNPRVDGDIDYGNPSFRWVASSDPNTIIAITLTTIVANVNTVICMVKDDGEFFLPAFANVFNGGNYTYVSRNILRKVNNYTKQGDSLLITSRFSINAFDSYSF